MSPVVWMSPALTAPGPCFFSVMRFGPSPIHLDRDVLDVENDVGHVLAHAGDRRKFMQNAVDMDGGDRRALQRGQQNAAQRIAQRLAEAALERFGDSRRLPARIVARRDDELARLDKFLPVFLDAHSSAFQKRRI